MIIIEFTGLCILAWRMAAGLADELLSQSLIPAPCAREVVTHRATPAPRVTSKFYAT